MKECWYYFLYIAIGTILFFAGHEAAISLEKNGDYDSISHRLFIATGVLGIMLAVIGLKGSYLLAKKECETNYK